MKFNNPEPLPGYPKQGNVFAMTKRKTGKSQ